jgi:hypothetical protein
MLSDAFQRKWTTAAKETWVGHGVLESDECSIDPVIDREAIFRACCGPRVPPLQSGLKIVGCRIAAKRTSAFVTAASSRIVSIESESADTAIQPYQRGR